MTPSPSTSASVIPWPLDAPSWSCVVGARDRQASRAAPASRRARRLRPTRRSRRSRRRRRRSRTARAGDDVGRLVAGHVLDQDPLTAANPEPVGGGRARNRERREQRRRTGERHAALPEVDRAACRRRAPKSAMLRAGDHVEDAVAGQVGERDPLAARVAELVARDRAGDLEGRERHRRAGQRRAALPDVDRAGVDDARDVGVLARRRPRRGRRRRSRRRAGSAGRRRGRAGRSRRRAGIESVASGAGAPISVAPPFQT